MKKLLFVLAIGAFAAACNDNTEKTSTTSDSTTTVAPATVDTAAPAPMDTTMVKVDSSKTTVKKDTTVTKK